jgi:hypothetical protein
VLGEDHGAIATAFEHNDVVEYLDAKERLDEDTNHALDAGCAVIDE